MPYVLRLLAMFCFPVVVLILTIIIFAVGLLRSTIAFLGALRMFTGELLDLCNGEDLDNLRWPWRAYFKTLHGKHKDDDEENGHG